MLTRFKTLSLVDNKYCLFVEKEVINSDGTEVEYVQTGSFDSLEEAREYVDMF